MMSGLLNLQNIPQQEITGLSDDELQWITNESNSRYVVELDPEFFREITEDNTNICTNNEDEFKDLEDEIKREMDEAEEEGIPTSTKFSTTQHVKKFQVIFDIQGTV